MKFKIQKITKKSIGKEITNLNKDKEDITDEIDKKKKLTTKNCKKKMNI